MYTIFKRNTLCFFFNDLDLNVVLIKRVTVTNRYSEVINIMKPKNNFVFYMVYKTKNI